MRDDTLTIVLDIKEARTVLENINLAITISIPNDKFTIKVAEQNTISFVGMKITKRGKRLVTSVHRMSTDSMANWLERWI